MAFARTISRRVAVEAIFAGFVAVFVAQNASISNSAPVHTDPLPVLASLPLAPATANVPVAPASDNRVATAGNSCETQNWPYFSKECLRGEAAAPAPRQVHLQPASTTPLPPPAPIVLALAYTGPRQTSEARQVNETSRRRKARQAERYASRPVVSTRRMQQPEPEGFGQALAFGW